MKTNFHSRFILHFMIKKQCSLCENCRSVGQNRQISLMSREFVSLAVSMSDETIIQEKNQTVILDDMVFNG